MEKGGRRPTDWGYILDLILSLYFIHYWTGRPEHSTAALTTNVCLCTVLIVEGRGITALFRNESFNHTSNNLAGGFPPDSRNLNSWHLRLHFLAGKGPDCRGMCGNTRYWACRWSCVAGYGNGFKGWSLETARRPGDWGFELRQYCAAEEKYINSLPFHNIQVTALKKKKKAKQMGKSYC